MSVARLLPAALLAATLAVPGPAPAQQGGAAAAQVQRLEEEVRRLNGRIEQLEHRLRQIADDAALRINDLEYRLTELEGGDPTAIGAPQPLGEAPARGPQPAVSERVALDDARARLEGDDPEAARRMLLSFLAQYPDGPLTAEAEYWLGMAEYRTGNLQAAAMSFLTNVTAYPDGPRAPDSLLMLGRALGALGQTAEACATLAELPRRHPAAAEAAAAAAEERRALDCR